MQNVIWIEERRPTQMLVVGTLAKLREETTVWELEDCPSEDGQPSVVATNVFGTVVGFHWKAGKWHCLNECGHPVMEAVVSLEALMRRALSIRRGNPG